MSSLPHSLGLRIQKMRLRQHRTLEAVAGECGFTKSLLSKIERGKTTPPVATLMKIASTLGVTVTDLLSANHAASTDFTAAATLADSKLTRTEKGYLFHLFAGSRSEKLMQPFLFVARKGEIRPGPLSHRGEEFIYVLSGEMTFRVGQMDYRLRAGDSLYFDSEQMHDLQPTSDKVTYLAVFADTHVKQGSSPRRADKAARHKADKRS